MKYFLVALAVILNPFEENEKKISSLNFELSVRHSMHGLEFEGVKLDDTGLTLKSYLFKKDFFWQKWAIELDSVTIPLNKLNKLDLYRLKMHLLTHNMLKNVDLRGNDQTTARPVHYILRMGNEQVLVSDKEYYIDQCENPDRHVINELRRMLNSLMGKYQGTYGLSISDSDCY